MQSYAEPVTRAHSARCGPDRIGVSAYTERVTFAKLVVSLREKQGWSQKELARRAHLHGQTVHNIEHGRNRGGRLSRTKLARAFGMSVAELESDSTIQTHEGDPVSGPVSTADEARAFLHRFATALVDVLARTDVRQQVTAPRAKTAKRGKRTGTDR